MEAYPRLTWRRWRLLHSTKYSMLRSLEYERIAGLRLTGRVLDVGGGEGTSYRDLVTVDGTLETLNVDPALQPTHCCDLNKPLPLPNGTFDAWFSLNTLEHISSDAFALGELCRILKPGGEAHLVVPFLYRVHGSPQDYHRHTASAWRGLAGAAGFEPPVIQVLGLGQFTAAFSMCEYLFPRILRWLVKNTCIGLDLLVQGVARSPRDEDQSHALGYYLKLRKPG